MDARRGSYRGRYYRSGLRPRFRQRSFRPSLERTLRGGICRRGRRLSDLRPESVAARRLLVFGTVATVWIGASVAISVGFEEYGRHWWLGPADVVVQVLGLAMGAAMIALLAVYPDGRYDRTYELSLVKAAAGLAIAVPIALLVTRPALQPAWVFAWDEGANWTPPFPGYQVPSTSRLFRSWARRCACTWMRQSLSLRPRSHLGRAALPPSPSPRLQMRWPIFGILIVLLAPLSAVLDAIGVLATGVAQTIQIVALVALPASAAVGLVKPTLFDVDRAMRRSLLYAPLWIAIAGAYVGLAAALGLAASGAGLQLAVAVTIGATLLFEPLRRFLAGRAARWAYGESLGGEELVQRLGGTLEHTLDLDRLVSEVDVHRARASGWVGCA